MRAHWVATLSIVLAGVPLTAAAAAGVVAAPPAPSCEGEAATLVGTAAPDVLVGTARRDVIVGLGGDDEISGRGGNDLICGNNGSDRLFGGPGDDQLFGGLDARGEDQAGTYLLGDVLSGGAGDDRLVGGHDGRRVEAHRLPDTVSYADALAGVVVDLSGKPGVATGQGTDTIRFGVHAGVRGSAYADTITGSEGDDHLAGGPGDDTVRGAAGDDTVLGEEVGAEAGDDLLAGGPGADLLGSYAGRDDVRGGPGDDFVEAYSDRPTRVAGDPGDDYVAQSITAGSGAGSAGGGGRDVLVLYGALLAGNTPRTQFSIDLRTGTTSADLDPPVSGTIGGFEEHRLVGNLRWQFHGSPLRDRVWAITGGALQAWTYAGDDWMRGTARDDTFDGGAGIDEAVGSGGSDTCRRIERGRC